MDSAFYVIIICDTPLPITYSNYICDKVFHVDDIKKLYADYSNIGIMLVSGDTAQFFLKKYNIVTKIKTIEIYRIKSHSKGGQSAQRFNRIQQSQYASFCTSITEELEKLFIQNSVLQIRSLRVGAVGPTIKDVVIPDKIKNIITIEQIQRLDVNLLNNQTADIQNEDKKVLAIIQEAMLKDKLIYGISELNECSNNGLLKYLIWHSSKIPKDGGFKEIVEKNGGKLLILETNDEKSLSILGYGDQIGISFY